MPTESAEMVAGPGQLLVSAPRKSQASTTKVAKQMPPQTASGGLGSRNTAHSDFTAPLPNQTRDRSNLKQQTACSLFHVWVPSNPPGGLTCF